MSQKQPTFTDKAYRYVQVADRIADRIERGELRPGDRLPGEFDLAEQYGVASAPARRALKELRTRQLVHTIAGKGSFVLPQTDGGKAGER